MIDQTAGTIIVVSPRQMNARSALGSILATGAGPAFDFCGIDERAVVAPRLDDGASASAGRF